jgi:hypothetical protein
MSSTTREHIDELEARRQRREGRSSAPASKGKPPRGPKSGEAARDLLRDLITNGPREGDDAPGASDAVTPSGSQGDVDGPTNGVTATGRPQLETRREGVDELVRRVQAGAETMIFDAARATRKRRPIGTADLSADAAGGRQASRAGRRRSRAEAALATKSKRQHWLLAAVGAGVFVAGVAFVLSLASAGAPQPTPARSASITSARLSSASIAGFGSALRSTIAVVDRELRAVALRASTSVRHERRKAKHPRGHSGRHPANAWHETAVQSGGRATSSTTSQGQSYTQAQSPVTSSSQSSATTQPSSSNGSQPAGPTNAGPLGGLGSCVKGCG